MPRCPSLSLKAGVPRRRSVLGPYQAKDRYRAVSLTPG